ncbi:MAG TPA: TIGR01906 family membrane protein [Anaerolineales bacterium]|nr:TIGR01906 family membrane protein [Anaerolineales bacterium]
MNKIISWLVTLLVPAALVLLGVRLLLTPLFVNVEYRMPYFPPDRYGFSAQERLSWAQQTRAYLLNDDEIETLAAWQFPKGENAAGDCDTYLPPRDCTYLYNDRELQHMRDVKQVTTHALRALWLSILGLVGFGFWAYKSGGWSDYRQGLGRGGWLTVGLILSALLYLAMNFNALFITFHRIFFEGNTWIFRYSDTLIRLFPVTFWRDAFIWVGAFALTSGALLGYWGSAEKH